MKWAFMEIMYAGIIGIGVISGLINTSRLVASVMQSIATCIFLWCAVMVRDWMKKHDEKILAAGGSTNI